MKGQNTVLPACTMCRGSSSALCACLMDNLLVLLYEEVFFSGDWLWAWCACMLVIYNKWHLDIATLEFSCLNKLLKETQSSILKTPSQWSINTVIPSVTGVLLPLLLASALCHIHAVQQLIMLFSVNFAATLVQYMFLRLRIPASLWNYAINQVCYFSERCGHFWHLGTERTSFHLSPFQHLVSVG